MILKTNKDGNPLQTKEVLGNGNTVYTDYFGDDTIFHNHTPWNGQASSITIATPDFKRGPDSKGYLFLTCFNYDGTIMETQREENNVRTIKGYWENGTIKSFYNDKFSIHYFENGSISGATFIDTLETYDIANNKYLVFYQGEVLSERELSIKDITKVNTLYSLIKNL